jgi:DNA-binding response OmpR family regulator
MPKKILVVDDELNILKLIATRLKANNYDVVTASDGLYAIKKVYEEKPDLIILDIKMPVGGGMGVFEILKTNGDTMLIPVIFITAYPNEETQRKVLEMGAEDFIAKPLNIEELMAKVKKALGEDIKKKDADGGQSG